MYLYINVYGWVCITWIVQIISNLVLRFLLLYILWNDKNLNCNIEIICGPIHFRIFPFYALEHQSIYIYIYGEMVDFDKSDKIRKISGNPVPVFALSNFSSYIYIYIYIYMLVTKSIRGWFAFFV